MIKFESINNFLKLIGGKWKIKILAELHIGPRRFSQLKTNLDKKTPTQCAGASLYLSGYVFKISLES